jgi:2-octaprenyl-6-methoxyphenol hydroxylase
VKNKIAIIGGGPIGGLCSVICSKFSEVDLFDVSFNHKNHELDGRVTALGLNQQRFLSSLQINCDYLSNIDAIHIRDQYSLNTITIAKDKPLGAMIEYAKLANSIQNSISKNNKNINKIERKIEKEEIEKLKNDYDLVVIASGGYNDFDAIWEKSPNEVALLFKIDHENSHDNTAIECFFDKEAIATLPLQSKNQSSCVWIMPFEKENLALNLDQENFIAALQRRFPHLGNITKAHKIISHALTRKVVWPPLFKGCGLIGDAAHKIHPIAGQGLNLGIRDVMVFEEIFNKRMRLGLSLDGLWNEYSKKRIVDLIKIVGVTEGSLLLFSMPIKGLRSLGMKVIENSSNIKHWLAEKIS